MISRYERDLLRDRALAAWQDGKRLHREAARLVEQSHELAAARQAGRMGRGRGAGDGAYEPEPEAGHWGAFTPTVVEALVDRALARSEVVEEGAAPDDGPAGLVASADMAELLRLGGLLSTCAPRLVGARDAGTALGLVIVTQPDLAVIDDRLDVAAGADLAVTLPLYAPQTTALLLSDDEETVARVQTAGIVVRSHDITEQELRSWAMSVLA